MSRHAAPGYSKEAFVAALATMTPPLSNPGGLLWLLDVTLAIVQTPDSSAQARMFARHMRHRLVMVALMPHPADRLAHTRAAVLDAMRIVSTHYNAHPAR